MPFTANEVLPGVHHIQDGMGVCMTLLTGSRSAVLVDTGYGLENVHAYVRTLTELPLTVVLTHGHHDHALGARWFNHTLMFPQDAEDFRTYTGAEMRKRIANQASLRGLTVPENYVEAELTMPLPLSPQTVNLGGMTVQLLHCPGHTPGSAVVYVKERQLLLTADDWNPCTWLFFPAALPMQEYRANVRKLQALPYTHVLCSHQPMLFHRSMMDDFLSGLTDEVLQKAKSVNIEPYTAIDTRQANLPHDQIFVFDWAKAGL